MSRRRASALSEERFQSLLEAYGARLAAWPEAEREAVEALLESSASARDALAREADLDRALFSASVDPALSTSLERRLAELPVRHPRPAGKDAQSALSHWLKRWFWAPALGFSALTLLAVVLGSRVDEAATAVPEEDVVTASDSLALELALGVAPEFEEGEP
ncbi:MAG TPA: hypothetical protein VFQ61_02695 [Polyangiaceae bacterium]|nr:hypothetical protein [Polyangiaceae bacterium]